jgi:hypothetical protein
MIRPALLLALLVASIATPASVREGREGTIAHSGSSSFYLAIPLGPGVRVRICAERCLTLTSTDAGPNREMLLAGRIADVDMRTFEFLCQCPASQGLVHGRWFLAIDLPATDTLTPNHKERADVVL